MSDCSTNAMRPKKGTCGNCGNSCDRRTEFGDSEFYYVPCLRYGTLECENNTCSDWEPRTDTLAQRYEHLEQVAKRLYRYIKNDADESWSPVKESAAGYYKEQLEALGVSVDG